MTIRHLKIFIAVAAEENITKASEKLYVTQPTISIAIKEIEEHYGILLFERMNQRLRITHEGKKFLSYATHIINLFDDMEKTFGNPDSLGDLRIGSSVTFGIRNMADLVNRFGEIYPYIHARVQIDSSDIIEKKILSNELDLAVIEGVVHSDYISSKEIQKDKLIAVCSPAYPLARQPHISLADFASERFLLREKNSGIHELFENAISLHGFKITPSWESTSVQALIQAARKSIGIAILPEKLVEPELAGHYLTELHVENFEIERSIKIIYHKNKFISEAMKAFMGLIDAVSEPSAETILQNDL